jgi:hypothetical protein
LKDGAKPKCSAFIATGEATDLKACVFSFTNANVIVKETGGRLVMVAV